MKWILLRPFITSPSCDNHVAACFRVLNPKRNGRVRRIGDWMNVNFRMGANVVTIGTVGVDVVCIS